jgi:hypothetical protein
MAATRNTREWHRALALAGAAVVGIAPLARTADITWIGGNGIWTDNAGTASWSPADEPDSNDVAIFNTANTITLGSQNAIAGLTMSAAATLDLAGFQLAVAGPTTIGPGRVELTSATSSFLGQNVTINSSGNFFLDGGTLNLSLTGAANAQLAINAGGQVSGNGIVNMSDVPAAVTTLINNNGTITASNPAIVIAPTAATLQFVAGNSNARIDLDGTGEAGQVTVARNQTLDIDIALTDIFNGGMSMSQNTTLDISSAWIFGAGATLNVDNGATAGLGGAPAGTSTIAGSSFSQNSGTITVLDADGTLRFDAPFTMNGGTLTNNGLVAFNNTATIGPAAAFDMIGDADLTVEANRTLTINQTNFNLDGTGAAGSVITVNNQGRLNLNSTDYDSDSATNAFNGTINLNSGTFNSTTGDASFVMDGVLNMANTAGGAPVWEGETLDIGNDAGALNADLNANGGGNVRVLAPIDFNSDADVNVTTGTVLNLENTANFNTVNGANNAEFTGDGSLIFFHTVNVNEAVTLAMTGGSVTFDGIDGTGNVINIDAPLTVKTKIFSDFGNTNGGGGTNTLDINNSAGLGILTVTLDDANAEWTLNAPGVINLVNDNTEVTLLAGADVNLNGTVNVTGDVRSTARLDIAGTVNINTAAQPFRLAGGNNTDDPNTIAGGTIAGVGLLAADTGKALQGFGTINTGIDFDGASNVRADNGTLTINGAIVDAGTVGTADVDGTLHVTNAWNNNVTAGVQLQGGTLSGGTMTNDVVSGISGHGLVTARVINNTQFFGSIGESLIFQTPGNDNDWDGTTNAGTISAFNGNVELRDNATFGFTGTVSATSGHRVFTSGFALDFNPGSTLTLASGGKYQSTSSTDIGGTVTIGAGADSTIEVANNFFLTFETGSATTLNGNLSVVNNNINIEAGATFGGGGALRVPNGSHFVADNLANINVLVTMEGAFRPGNFEGIGRVQIFEYQSTDTSQVFAELRGTGLNQFDRLVITGDAIIDGYLSIDIDEVSPGVLFVPTLGQTFNIITANTITGTFDYKDVSGMPAGLTFAVKYLGNAVQLQVVPMPIFTADFDDDGDVDLTDLAIWRGAYNLNQLGDANGDNITDASDWTIWREQFGSAPSPLGPIVAPEPASLGALLLAGLFGRRRRRARAAVAGAALLGAASVATAAPTLSVVDGGLLSGNRQWIVRITPDAALIANGHGGVATELGIEITGSTLLGATKNAVQWPYDLPGITPPTYPSLPPGGGMAISGNKLFASFGNDLFNAATPVQLMQISTLGSGSTTLLWGEYTVPNRVKGIRIAQGGQLFDGQFGSLTIGGILGDFDNDGALDADDIDLMHAAAEGPVTAATMKFDLNNDGNIERSPGAIASDADIWVTVLKDTGYGDANFDKTVGFADLVLLAQHYNLTPRSWSQGNFDDVAGVGFGDLVLLAQNYNLSFTADEAAANGFSADFAGDWALAQSLVPEPTAALVVVPIVAAASGRRRTVRCINACV